MSNGKTAEAKSAAAGGCPCVGFLDMIAPSIIKFQTDYFICGNTFRCVWALREYPTSTDEQAILRHLGEKDGITLHIYTRHVTPYEERKIISNAANKNRMKKNNTNDLQQTITAEDNLQDVAQVITATHLDREPLIHTAILRVFVSIPNRCSAFLHMPFFSTPATLTANFIPIPYS